MEDLLMVTSDEHKVLKKFKMRLEKRHHVIINMPDTDELSESDLIFVSIVGEKCNTENVQKFLSQRMKAKKEKVDSKKNVVLITLSDSEDSDSVSSDSESKENSVSIVDELACANNYPKIVKKSSECNPLDKTVCLIDCSKNSPKNNIITLQNIEDEKVVKKSSVCNLLDNSIYIIDGPEDSPKTNTKTLKNVNKRKRKNSKRKLGNKKARIKDILMANEAELCEISNTVEVCEASSTTEESVKKAQPMREELADFIPLGQEGEKKKTSEDKCSRVEEKSDVILLDEPVSAPRPLRPIVIDGSNVAIEHGKVSHCFSAKGIQLAVEYFLKRGHTDVHAFVPKFRRISNPKHNFPTKDAEILDELANKQFVVFTPSRRVNGKCIASYDDRFIVDLASRNGGVIVSNDNYRDLIGESDSFKESIENRLLMFCFVGDIFMVPSDPLGRNGPSLEDYLSFPPEGKT